MFDVVLFQPEIPPNAGNVIRLCANSGTSLHLVKPLGFDLHHRQLKRAGLDYHDLARVTVHEDWESCLRSLAGRRIFAVSTKGRRRYDSLIYKAGDVFLFGPETRGLPQQILKTFDDERCIRLPMVEQSRSMNLSNTVAIMIFEAWRQHEFSGGA